MGKAFYSIPDAKSKLSGTIIMYRDEPYSCEYWQDNIYRLTSLKDNNIKIDVDYRDDAFDYSNIRLGYIQDGENAKYIARHALRRVRQAFDAESIRHLKISGSSFYGLPMYNCIKGIHPSFTEACKAVLDSEKQSACFSRNFAIKRDNNLGIILLHRDNTIAVQSIGKRFALLNSGAASIILGKLQKHGVEIC